MHLRRTAIHEKRWVKNPAYHAIFGVNRRYTLRLISFEPQISACGALITLFFYLHHLSLSASSVILNITVNLYRGIIKAELT